MYTYTFGQRTHEIEELPALRKAVYSHMAHEGQRIQIEKDGEPYGFMVMLDDGVWIYTNSDKEYRRVRAGGTVAQ